jgi:hypothetical protein
MLLKNYFCFLLFTISIFRLGFLDFTDLQHEVEIADVVSETHPAVPVPTTATASPIPSTTFMLVPAVAPNLCFDTVVRADPMSRQPLWTVQQQQRQNVLPPAIPAQSAISNRSASFTDMIFQTYHQWLSLNSFYTTLYGSQAYPS